MPEIDERFKHDYCYYCDELIPEDEILGEDVLWVDESYPCHDHCAEKHAQNLAMA